MNGEPKVYIAVEDESGQLIVRGPLELLERLLTTLAGQRSPSKAEPELTAETARTTGANHV